MDRLKDVSDISQRSKFFFTNTMLCLLKALEGKCVVVELRNDCVIRGRLLSVDAAMGLIMSKVLMTNVKGEKVRYDQFYIQGRKIRYVQIPDEINIVDTIQWQLSKVKVGLDKAMQKKKKLFEKKVQRRDKAQQKLQDQQGDRCKETPEQHQHSDLSKETPEQHQHSDRSKETPEQHQHH